MINRDLNHQLQLLQSLFDRTRVACGENLEMRSHWAKYLSVRCAGFLENSLKAIYSDFCSAKASLPVATFAKKNLDRLPNPNSKRITELAGQFKSDWGRDLEKYISDNGRKEAIDAIIAQRHCIAHG